MTAGCEHEIEEETVRVCILFARYASRSANYRSGLTEKVSESPLINSDLATLSGIRKALLAELRKQL